MRCILTPTHVHIYVCRGIRPAEASVVGWRNRVDTTTSVSPSVSQPLQCSPQILRPEVERSQRSSLSGGRRLRAGRCSAGVETTAGRAKPPGGWPGGNGSLVVSAELSGAKCTLRLVRAPGGEKSRKRTPGGRPRGRGNASGAEGSLQAFRRRVETLSVLVPICRVKWCRDRLRTV